MRNHLKCNQLIMNRLLRYISAGCCDTAVWILKCIKKKVSNEPLNRRMGRRDAAWPEKEQSMSLYRMGSLGLSVALAVAGVTGCATKNYVKNQTAPLVDHTNQLEEKTATNNRQIHDVDDRAQSGIKQAQGAADSATQNAENATKSPLMRSLRLTKPSIVRILSTAWSRGWITTKRSECNSDFWFRQGCAD